MDGEAIDIVIVWENNPIFSFHNDFKKILQ